MTDQPTQTPSPAEQARELAARVAAKTNLEPPTVTIPPAPADLWSSWQQAENLDWQGTALESTQHRVGEDGAGWWEREQRASHTRADFDDRDIQEVEYRRVQLERVFLVGVFQTQQRTAAENSLKELAALADTAGATVVGAALQRRDTPDPATFIGKGKAQELAGEVAANQADTVIVNAPLQPSQRRGLEDILKVKVIDRTAVILDIFAQHAQSREGKMQVELAQLEYLLPRLRGWGESMSRQAGGRVAGGAGIGSRGPGETKIELDRRRINQRMAKLRKEIANLSKSREIKRRQRKRQQVASVAIVGYTNAGKSSLLNQLTEAEVMVQNALFATLDTTVRKAQTSDGRLYTLTDTVGFVSDLPHELVEAFRSTLEEVGEADLLVHVVDAAHSDPLAQIESVHQVLSEVEGLQQVPEIIVLNKIDLADPVRMATLKAQLPTAIAVSAWTGQGMAELRAEIENQLPRPRQAVDYILPFDQSKLVARLHSEGTVEKVEYLPEGTHVVGRADPALARAMQDVAIYLSAANQENTGWGGIIDEGEAE